jgi:DNA-binding XRE family transcriptional regulator
MVTDRYSWNPAPAAATNRYPESPEIKLVGVGIVSNPSMDPNHGSPHIGDYPWTKKLPTRKPSGSIADAANVEWLRSFMDEHTVRLKAELQRELEWRPSGARIHTLRAVRGWTQRTVARVLGISVRTVIRHEQSHNRYERLRSEPHIRLRKLESGYAEQIIAYITRIEPEQSQLVDQWCQMDIP